MAGEDLYGDRPNQGYGNPAAPGFSYGEWGGQGGAYHLDPNTNQWTVDRQRGAEEAANTYGSMGADITARREPNTQTYKADYGDYQYGMGQGREAMDLQREAAMGKAPSAAEIAGRAAMETSNRAS